jgi:glycosyltransferase involved in cell wall biosynthesis
MAGSIPSATHIAYVGFVLGHGGDALQMLDLARGASERDARVSITVPEIPSTETFAERCRAVGVECVRSPLISVTTGGARQGPIRISRLLRSTSAPIVHFHTGNSCLPRSVMTSLEVMRYRRCFVTVQSPYETIVPGSLRARFWAWTAARRLAAVVSPSDHATQFQLRCGVPAEIATTIRNSIDIAAMAGGDPAGPRAALGVGPDVPIVLFSSRIDAQKRPVETVQIFASVAAEFPRALLVFVGKGDLEDAVAAEAVRLGISDRVRLMGYQTNVPDWLAASTVWLLPTERENFSVAVLEALAAGCVVLSTTCHGNDEVLIDGENALTFAVGDVTGAAAALRKLLSDGELRNRLCVGARRSGQEFSVSNMVENYLALYEQRIPGSAAPAVRSVPG